MKVNVEEFEELIETQGMKSFAISFDTEKDAVETIEYLKTLNKNKDVTYTCFKTDDKGIYDNSIWVFAYKTQEELDYVMQMLACFGSCEHNRDQELEVVEDIECPFK